jgi:hypothetical protein
LREALAASHIDFSPRDERAANVKRRAKPGEAKRVSLWGRVLGALGGFRSGLLFGFLGVVAIGVPFNALFMQDGRRPVRSVALNPPQIDLARHSQAAPLPPPRPASVGAARADAQKTEPLRVETTKPAENPVDPIAQLLKPVDPIGQLLKGGASQKSNAGAKNSEAKNSDAKNNKAVIFAQRALAKLGYALHQDGVYGGTTRQAIEKFERSNGLPVKGELSPKILRLLGARAGVAFK